MGRWQDEQDAAGDGYRDEQDEIDSLQAQVEVATNRMVDLLEERDTLRADLAELARRLGVARQGLTDIKWMVSQDFKSTAQIVIESTLERIDE